VPTYVVRTDDAGMSHRVNMARAPDDAELGRSST
jgi:hypothetical protein